MEIENVSKNSVNLYFCSKYVDLVEVLNMVCLVFVKYGIVII